MEVSRFKVSASMRSISASTRAISARVAGDSGVTLSRARGAAAARKTTAAIPTENANPVCNIFMVRAPSLINALGLFRRRSELYRFACASARSLASKIGLRNGVSGLEGCLEFPAGQDVSAMRLRECLLEATGRRAEPLRPIASKQGIVQPDDVRVVVECCEVVPGFGIRPATGYDGLAYLLRQPLDAFGAPGRIDRRNGGLPFAGEMDAKTTKQRCRIFIFSSKSRIRWLDAGEAASSPEAFAIFTWAGANASQKGSAHHVGICEAAARCDALQGFVGLFEQPSGRVDACHLDEVARRHSSLLLKDAGKIAHAHRGPRGKRLHRQVKRQMIEDPMLDRLDAPFGRHLGGKVGAELRLAARSLQEDNQPARDGERNIASVIVLYQLQCEVDSGGNTGRGPQRTVLHEDLIGYHCCGWKSLRQFPSMLPMRRHAEAVQQSGGTEKEGAGADGAVTTAARRVSSQPGMERRVRVSAGVVGGASDQQRIDRLLVFKDRAVGQNRHRSSRHGSIRTDRQQAHIVVASAGSLPIGFQKGIQRTGNVQRLRVRRHNNRDRRASHLVLPHRKARASHRSPYPVASDPAAQFTAHNRFDHAHSMVAVVQTIDASECFAAFAEEVSRVFLPDFLDRLQTIGRETGSYDCDSPGALRRKRLYGLVRIRFQPFRPTEA